MTVRQPIFQGRFVDYVRANDLVVWSALALPTLKLVRPHFRHGAVVLTDNTMSGAEGYRDLLSYLRSPENGFRTHTVPYTNGLEMSVYLPKQI